MEYREHKRLGTRTSHLGFGCMRLPLNKDGTIIREPAYAMLEQGRAAGVNYYDTAWNYTGGDNETILGEVLPKWPRDSFYVATKLPTFKVTCLEDAQRFFDQHLERLNLDYIDFYLLHALDKERWDNMVRLGVLEWCEELKAEGKIRHFGFSFHDEYPVFEEIMAHHQWDFCQIQLNYLDTGLQAGMAGYELATKLDIPVIIMEPVKGGILAAMPEQVAQPLKDYAPHRSVASWAMRWIGTLPNVITVLSGMSTKEQVEDNLATFEQLEPLTEAELALIDETVKTMNSLTKSGCTGCSYCMPCPAGVNIPENFTLWNESARSEGGVMSWRVWNVVFPDGEKAKHCIDCGKCEALCPQHLSIRADLAKLQQEMDAIQAP